MTMKLLLITGSLSLLLSGCSTSSNVEEQSVVASNTETASVYKFPQSPRLSLTDEEIYNEAPLQRNINFYVRGMMQDLTANIEKVNDKTPLAVSSFIYLDGQDDESSLLGNQISESLIHEIHKVGIPVLDHKVTDYMRVTEKGDFIISRDFNEITPNLAVSYVVTGNLVKHQGGYLVNARIVGIKEKNVVASAQSFIPRTTARALLQSEAVNEIPQVGLVGGN